jgi:hypothetical protein
VLLNKEAKNYEAIYKAIKQHNNDCPSPPNGIAMSYFDIERMGWEEGDIIAGLPLVAEQAQAGYLRILCDGTGTGGGVEEEVGIDEPQEADADAPRRREREVVTV